MKYVHTNLIAHDWRRLAAFYERVFRCERIGPERDISGPDLDAATGLHGARLRGAHLALPGTGGQTLEIFSYDRALPTHRAPNRHGFGHLAFAVDDVAKVVRDVTEAGGGHVGETVTVPVAGAGAVTFAYVTDPEGNIVEVQSWECPEPPKELPSDVRGYNRAAWDLAAQRSDRWSTPISVERIADARAGRWQVVLTPTRPVPRAWFPETMAGARVLGLASSGGQQCPLFAAAGATVTAFDNSPGQLALDRVVAEREGLELTLIEGDMRDLGALPDASFDLVFHPVSNVFVPDVRPVWREAFRVLRPGGALLSGFMNPIYYALDYTRMLEGDFALVHPLPYRDLDHPALVAKLRAEGDALEFGHTWDDQLGGQIDAGFVIAGFYLDSMDTPVDRITPTTVATRAIKPG